MLKTPFTIWPVGIVHKEGDTARIEIFEEYLEALSGLSEFSHLDVYYWFDQNDTQELRKILRVHPRKDPKNPLTGVFATHSPIRPNLIGHTVCKILSIDHNLVTLDDIDAFDLTPVIDIKSHIPREPKGVVVPPWMNASS